MEDFELKIVAIDEVRVIRNKRKARKGNITKIQNALRLMQDKPLVSLSQEDLKKKVTALEENIAAFEILQDRLEELKGHDGDSVEELEEQRCINDLLVSEYGLLLEARQAWELAGEIKDNAASLTASKSITGTTGRKECERLWKDYSKLRQAARHLTKWDELATLRDEMDPIIVTLKERFDSESDTGHTHKSPIAPKGTDHFVQSRLKTTLPKFSGNVLEWETSAVQDKIESAMPLQALV